MKTRDTESQSLPEPAEPRRLRDAMRIVVAVYALMVLAAPLILRYWPDPDSLPVAAPAYAAAAAAPHCTPPPASGPSCPPRPAPDDMD